MVARPPEKFSRPLRGARFTAEHAGVKAAGGSGPRSGRSDDDGGGAPPRCADVPLSGTHGIELVSRAVK